MTEITPVTVRVLLCHRHVDMALTCLGSLLKFSTDPLHLAIHDDGTLTPEDGERLAMGLNNPTILWRSQTNEMMAELLKNHPTSLKYRYKHPLIVKLLDIPLLSEGDMAYCDSDILFFRPFSGLYYWPDSSTSAMFMTDHQEAYSVQPWHLATQKIQLCSRINSGLILLKKQAYDLDFVEWYLSQPDFRHRPAWGEQTCFAAIGYRANCRLWVPEQVCVIRPKQSPTPELIAGHFTSVIRYRMDEFLANATVTDSSAQPVLFRTKPARSCTTFDLTKMLLKRKVKHVTYQITESLRRSPLGNYKRKLSGAMQGK